ncbi:MAG: CoA-binding protein, partial [Candidatus Aenigmatarchaeota archaeon]
MVLERFFSAKSIAVIGASRHPHKIGHVIFRNLIEYFKGKTFAVNPSAEEILGKRCYAKVTDIQEHIDLAIITTPANIVSNVLEDCGKAGIKAVIIISAGFSEIGNV